jgi:hypothetical protein
MFPWAITYCFHYAFYNSPLFPQQPVACRSDFSLAVQGESFSPEERENEKNQSIMSQLQTLWNLTGVGGPYFVSALK